MLGAMPTICLAHSFAVRSSLFRFRIPQGAIMTAPAIGTTAATSISKKTIGYLVQLGGIAAITLGAVLSLHHAAIGAAYLGGAAAFYVGGKIPTMS
jgi:hypothetical protein